MTRPSYLTEFTFQKEWVEKRGFFLVLAFFLGGLGAGLYLMSMYLGFYPGLITGFLIVVVGKGVAHIIYLGKPWRFWRGFLRPQTSWISRGLLSIVVFAGAAVFQLAPTIPRLSWLPWTADNLAIQVFVIIGALALMAYTGFALSAVRAIRAWNTSLMPVLFIVYSFMGGTGLALGMLSGIDNTIDIASVETIAIWLLIIGAVLLGIYLLTTNDTAPEGKRSVFELVRGRASPYFLVGVVFFGLVIPLFAAGYSLLVHEMPPAVIAIVSACELIGGFSMRYSIFKAGAYAPLA